MSATQISLLGRFSAALYEQILERIGNAAHEAEAFDCTEQVFERGNNGLDENLLRLRSVRRARNHRTAQWSMEVLLKPETARFSAEMLVRRTIVVDLKAEEGESGVSAKLISSLGYSYKFSLYRRGVELRRGNVTTQIYQLYQEESSTTSIDPSAYLITIFTTTADPIRKPASTSTTAAGNAPTTTTGGEGDDIDGNRQRAMGRIREVRDLLTGLVDVARVE